MIVYSCGHSNGCLELSAKSGVHLTHEVPDHSAAVPQYLGPRKAPLPLLAHCYHLARGNGQHTLPMQRGG